MHQFSYCEIGYQGKSSFCWLKAFTNWEYFKFTNYELFRVLFGISQQTTINDNPITVCLIKMKD